MILDIEGGKGWLRVTCLMADSMSSQKNGWGEYNRMFTQLLGSCHWTATDLLAPEDRVETPESLARASDRLRYFIADPRILRGRMAEFEFKSCDDHDLRSDPRPTRQTFFGMDTSSVSPPTPHVCPISPAESGGG